MGKIVLETDILDLHKPRFCAVGAVCQHIFGSFMENVVGKSADHSKEGELSNVKETREGEGASEEEDYRFRSPLVEFLERFKSLLIVLGDCLDLRL